MLNSLIQAGDQHSSGYRCIKFIYTGWFLKISNKIL